MKDDSTIKKALYIFAKGVLYTTLGCGILTGSILVIGLIHFLIFQITITMQIILVAVCLIIWAGFYNDIYTIDKNNPFKNKGTK